ncbi:MAG: aldehyde ferredoxin oxidoreductase family protein [Candidatus Hodarchaeota archaeon]
MKGLIGKVLMIDLTNEKFEEMELPEQIYREYIGGYGLAIKLIYENTHAKYNPLGPDAILGFFPGLLTGTPAPMTGRFMVAGKSPLTGTWGDSNCGGYFGPEIKRCGYDAILIKGTSSYPKYIALINDEKYIFEANDLWGLDVVETEEKLKNKHGNVQTAVIGLSGEKLSLISGIVNDKARIAGRSGFGAVMGSKKLKALVLKGNKKIKVENNDELISLTKGYIEALNSAPPGPVQAYKMQGTTFGNTISFQVGDTPVKNWGGNKDDYPNINNISGEEIDKYKQKPYGCFSCPIRCGAIMKVPEVGLEETHRPEYETCAIFGPLLLNDDLNSIFLLNDLCNRAGIDTISTGGTVAFAIECFENGLLTKDDTDGLQLTWGNSEAIIQLVKKIIQREGIGDILADGSKVASEKLKRGEEFAIHSMGQEIGMHSPQYYKSLGASYAFDPTPGRHTSASLDMLVQGLLRKPNGLFEGVSLPKKFKRKQEEDRYEAEKIMAVLWQFTCSIGLCEFAYFMEKYPLFELIKAVVGWDLSAEEALKTGQRIQTLRQAFNIREGVNIINNMLPERTGGEDYLEDYKFYCEKIGWNPENGYPKVETLKDLNLEFVIKDLE